MKTDSKTQSDAPIQSIEKTILWRIIATIITGVTVYAYTGELRESTKITITAAIALTIGYYIHERFWAWIKRQPKK